jgi:hypothetical protein
VDEMEPAGGQSLRGRDNNSALSVQSPGRDAIQPTRHVRRIDESATIHTISPVLRDWIKNVIVPILVQEYLEKRK